MSISVLTRGYSNTRDGANLEESVLTAAAVRSRGIRRLFSLPLPGDRRGAEAQPLILAGARLPGGRTRDLVLLATMANQVFAFDANDGTPIWQRTLGLPVDGSRDIDAHLINDHWGILSTPVVDAAAGVMYACAWISPDGSSAKAQHWLHAVSIVDGEAVRPPLNLEGVLWDPGHGLPVQRFASAARKQRASLSLVSGTVFIAFGSVRETSRDSRGWIIACDTNAWRISAAWAGAAKGFGAGIWQAGSGLVADREGFIYCMTGNGTFDAVTDWAESFLRLRYNSPSGGQAGSIVVVDWWTPWTDDGRSGLDRSGDELDTPNPTNLRVYTIDHNAGWDDGSRLRRAGAAAGSRLDRRGRQGRYSVRRQDRPDGQDGAVRPGHAGRQLRQARGSTYLVHLFPGVWGRPDAGRHIDAQSTVLPAYPPSARFPDLLAHLRARADAVLLGGERQSTRLDHRRQWRRDLSRLQC